MNQCQLKVLKDAIATRVLLHCSISCLLNLSGKNLQFCTELSTLKVRDPILLSETENGNFKFYKLVLPLSGSAPNNSNETVMCLGRAGCFGQCLNCFKIKYEI